MVVDSETKEKIEKEGYRETVIGNPDQKITNGISFFTNKLLKLSLHILRNVVSLVLLAYSFANHQLLYKNKRR